VQGGFPYKHISDGDNHGTIIIPGADVFQHCTKTLVCKMFENTLSSKVCALSTRFITRSPSLASRRGCDTTIVLNLVQRGGGSSASVSNTKGQRSIGHTFDLKGSVY
jgi:hypothetical protein